MSDRPLESYLVNQLAITDQELRAGHQVLDMKQVPRAVEGRPTLSLAARILLMIGELPAVQPPAGDEDGIDDLPELDPED